jgi:hypothetical protein
MRKLLVVIPWCVWAVIVAGVMSGGAVAGEVVFRADFREPAGRALWQPAEDVHVHAAAGPNGAAALVVEQPKREGPGSPSVEAALPLEKIRGTRVLVEARIKAQDVAKPPQPYNGVKVMLHSVSPGGPDWTQQDNIYGTFDWKRICFTAVVPSDASEARLVLGLEATSGRVGFADVRVSVIGRRRKQPAVPLAVDAKAQEPRFRGTMIAMEISADDLRALSAWKANHVRWQLTWDGFPRSPADKGDLAAYDAWLTATLAHLDRLLPLCRELGLRVVVDLHTPPGGRTELSECRLFRERRFQDALLAVWERIARRYRGNPAIWDYDLVNEPVEGEVSAGVRDWHSLCEETARRVRAIDPEHAIIVEPAPWASPSALDWFEPIRVPGVVYSVHLYEPMAFTHQGVYGAATGVAYPGQIGDRLWNRAELARVLKPVVEFQRDYGARIYIGEFSAVRWAPGDSACNYLRDAIDLFEEHGWDWAYHAFREWDGWSVEHGPDPQDHRPTAAPGDRQRLLRAWFEKNVR